MLETFYRTHAYLIEHFNAPVRRALMDSIDWSYRLIGIKGPRGVGRTSFLLQYAKAYTNAFTSAATTSTSKDVASSTSQATS